MNGVAAVEYGNNQPNCFAILSWPLRNQSGGLKIICIEAKNGAKHFISVIGTGSTRWKTTEGVVKNVITVNGKFGKALKLNDGEQVFFREIDSTPLTITTARLSCCSVDDWEILETNATFVTEQLLSQLRVLYSGQQFPFWLSKSMVINMKVDEIEPSSEFGVIAPNTDVIIPSMFSSRKHPLPGNFYRHYKLRIHPLTIPTSVILLPSETLLFSNIYHGFTYRSHLKLPDHISDSIIVQLVGVDKEEIPTSPIFVRLHLIDVLDCKLSKHLTPFVNIPCIYLHSELLKIINLCTKYWVWLSAMPENQCVQLPTKSAGLSSTEIPLELEYCGLKSTIKDCIEHVKALLSLSNMSCEHSFTGPAFGSILIHGALGSGKTSLASEIARILSQAPYYIHWEYVACAKLRGKKSENVEKELINCLKHLESKQPAILILDDLDVLTSAPKAEEKSPQEEFLHFKICETIFESLAKYNGNRIAVICTALSKDTLNEYWNSRPGFHFFQIHVKISSPSKAERLEIFQSYLNRYLKNSGIGVLNCFNQKVDASLNQKYNQIDNNCGNELNPTLVSIPFEKKGAILYHTTEVDDGLWNDELKEQIGSALGAIHDQNVTPQLLVNVAKKWGAHVQSIEQNVAAGRGHVSSSGACGINNIKTNEDVNEQMMAFNEILEEEIRFSGDLDGLKSMNSVKQKISWDFVGGLNSVKQELTKILEWPIKFPQFFRNAPVKLPCGILFYGYPGTGKTLMGLAIQSIVHVKFIHVKGPELLSKYIGASEQAVQDVFTRARESRPCILFFDEFDSLVPRRGHDSSGVTDRVVNQFLSEMDGIDGGLGEGVYLIAATSRPDLIDPAVLRPGRLDRHLFFDLPTEVERKEILKAISSQVSLKLESEQEWDEICKFTEGFTGADLNSLVFSAQLTVVQEYLSKWNKSEVDKMEDSTVLAAAKSPSNTQEIKVTRESLLSSIKDFQPSMYGQELRKFQAIYKGFSGAKELSAVVGTKLEEGLDKPWELKPGKRATLA